MKEKRQKENYFDGLIGMAQSICTQGKILREFFSAFHANGTQEIVSGLCAIGEKIFSESEAMTKRLAADFLPPADREDLYSVSVGLVRLSERIRRIGFCLHMTAIGTLRAEVGQVSRLLGEMCGQVLRLVKEFKNFKKSAAIEELCGMLRALKSRSEKMLSEAVRALYRSGGSGDVLAFVGQRELYGAFADCFDEAEAFADVVGFVVLKNR